MSEGQEDPVNVSALADALVTRTAERDRAWRNSLDILVVADANGVFSAVSPSWKTVLGHHEAEVVGRSFHDFVVEDDVSATKDAVVSAAAGVDVGGFRNRYRHKDGSSRLLAWRTSSEDGMIYGYARDVTVEQQQADELDARVRERERLWTTSPMLFARAAFDSTILEVNAAWTTMLGWTADELVGQSYADFVYAEDAARSLDWADRKAAGQHVEELQNRYRCKEGDIRWIAWSITTDADVFHCVGRDITEQRAQAEALKSREEDLRQVQKVEAIGQLTAGIAHDFNNLLTPIVGALDLLLRKYHDDARSVRLILGAQQSAERARILVSRLLTFGRRQNLKAQPVAINALAKGMVDMIARTIGSQIDVVVDIADDMPFAMVDANEFELALLNLCVNARDAMPEGGTLTIASDWVDQDDSDTFQLSKGTYVRVCVSDNGHGMDADTLRRATEPFYTTKGVGKGTGLGLSIVQGFAAQSGGGTHIVSTPSEGTTVTIWLPAAEGTASTSLQVDCGDELVECPPRKVLLVDDQELLLEGASEMLRELGHEVTTASSGAAALAHLRSGRSFDVMLTDYMMPNMTGLELITITRAILPSLPAALITGFADVATNDVGVRRLSKPFNMADLGSLIAELTGGS